MTDQQLETLSAWVLGFLAGACVMAGLFLLVLGA